MIVEHFESQFNPATQSILEEIENRQSEMHAMVGRAVAIGQSFDLVERELHRQLFEIRVLLSRSVACCSGPRRFG